MTVVANYCPCFRMSKLSLEWLVKKVSESLSSSLLLHQLHCAYCVKVQEDPFAPKNTVTSDENRNGAKKLVETENSCSNELRTSRRYGEG